MLKFYSKNIFTERSPIHIGYTIFKNEERSYAHRHDFYEFFIVESGILHHIINGQRYTIKEGHLCFINANDIHSFQKAKNSEDVKMLNVAFKEDLLVEAFDYLFHEKEIILTRNKDHILLNVDTYKLIKTKINLLMDNGLESFSHKQTFLFKSLLIDVLCQFADDDLKSNSEIPVWLINAIKDMQRKENFVEGLKRFIKLSEKSQEHLTRLMKKFYNTTPTSFINSLRLYEAAKLLLNSNLLVSEIMYEVGFNNVSHFMKLFKERFGSSPKNYGRSNKLTH